MTNEPNSSQITEALLILKDKMHNDPNYAWGWHCNIAIPMCDEGVDHMMANKGAARIMKLFFDLDTSQFPEYQAIKARYDDAYNDALIDVNFTCDDTLPDTTDILLHIDYDYNNT